MGANMQCKRGLDCETYARMMELSKYRARETCCRDLPKAKSFTVPTMAKQSHLLLYKDHMGRRQKEQAQKVATAFTHTSELAKRLCQQQATDKQLEEIREVLRTAIAYYRRRRSLHRRLAMIPEAD